MKHLEKGTKLYFVIESLSDRTFRGEPYHFEIISGEINDIRHFEGSRADEYRVPTQNRMCRPSVLEYPRCKDFGKSFFMTFEEAAEAAEKATANYEKIWGWAIKQPLIRPWRTTT